MGKRDGRQKGPQPHAEGQHGSKTHHAFIRELHGRQASGLDEPERAGEEHSESRGSAEGNRRLQEGRQQHDPAERNSEMTEVERSSRRLRTADEGDSAGGAD